MSETVDDLLTGLDADDLDDFDEVGENVDPPSLPHVHSPLKGRKAACEDHAWHDPFTTPLPTVNAGFATGRGQTLPAPSAATFAQVRNLFDDTPITETLDTNLTDEGYRQKRLKLASGASLFTTGNGKTVPPPSRQALDSVSKLFEEPEVVSTANGSDIPVSDDLKAPNATSLRSSFNTGGTLFTTGSGQAAPSMGEAAAETVASLFGDIGQPSRAAGALPSASQADHHADSAFQHFNPTPQPRSPATAFRSPLSRVPINVNTDVSANPPREVVKCKPVVIRTPSTSRRLGLGSTPRKSTGTAKSGFVTPFKRPGTPVASRSSLYHPSPLRALPMSSRPAHREEGVFDLTLPPDHLSLRQAHLKPQYNSIEDLERAGVPSEIWTIDLTSALSYHFPLDNGSTYDRSRALTDIQRDGCPLATIKWVNNHWSLILWKLAGEIQAESRLFREKWCSAEMTRQLRYRYEREFNACQRPLIRRIHEHDSSSSIPMILCVSAIHQPRPTEMENGGMAPSKPFIELTDGWYRINAEIDDCLVRAVRRGLLRIGRKLAISGARLDSASDGEDALDALDKSRLIISGNSCALARWWTKLGRQEDTFVAGLSSLSIDGGAIALMDVVIEKIFPLAFVSGDRGSKEPPWNEAEEAQRADQWTDGYAVQMSKLQDELRSRMEKLSDVVDTLTAHAQEVEISGNDSPPQSIEDDLDQILASNRPIATLLRGYSDHRIRHLAHQAQMRFEQEMDEARADMEAELQTACPKREVRDFRIVRFVDAREGNKEAARVGMLNVWDAKGLGEGYLREGARYLISNLMPARAGDWSLPRPPGRKEIYLNTRRDTRWTALVDQG